jgi:hypothetical protein
MGNKNENLKAHKVNVIKFMCTVVGGQKKDKHLLLPIIFFSFIFGNLFLPCLKSFLYVPDIGPERSTLHTPRATLCSVPLGAAFELATQIIMNEHRRLINRDV